MTSENYYSVLGVLSNAEDVVIRGAYRSLAQRYHPDKNASAPLMAAKKMMEISKAYAILSDPIKRKEYDESQRGASALVSGSYEDERVNRNGSSSDTDEHFEKNWHLACGVYTSLEKIFHDLEKISSALSGSYRIYMLETKQFDKRREIAEKMETEFLTLYFGNSSILHDFARELILSGRRDVALALNQLVRVVGGNDPRLIVQRIEKDFQIVPEAETKARNTAKIISARLHTEKIEKNKFWANISFFQNGLYC